MFRKKKEQKKKQQRIIYNHQYHIKKKEIKEQEASLKLLSDIAKRNKQNKDVIIR